jgi:hypothetical protein
MFGCTGWGKKIRWILNDSQMTDSNKGRSGNFDIIGIETKPLTDVERWLIYSVFHIINVYGTIGGKCMLKPSTNSQRGHYCDDRGKVEVISPDLKKKPSISKDNIKTIFSDQKMKMERDGKRTLTEWPNLKRFLFSPEEALDATNYMELVNFKVPYRDFLKGNHRVNPARANKFASFKNENLPMNSNQKKFWGYTKDENEMYDDVHTKLKALGLSKIKEGQAVLDEL